MKILHVVASLDPYLGGPTSAVEGLAKALSRKGHEVAIFTIESPPRPPPVLQNVTVRCFPLQFLRSFRVSFPLADALKKQIPHFDIVHIHALFQFATLAAAHYCRKYNRPYVMRPLGHLDPYGLKRHAFLKRLYLELFERRNLEHAALLHFTSEQEQRLSEQLGIRARKSVVGMGIDLSEYHELPAYGVFRSQHPRLKDKKIVLFLSRINHKKGLDILTEAFIRLCRKRQDVCLVIAGPDNEGYGKKVKGWLAKAGIADRVVFVGMLSGRDKAAAYRDSDIFVLPSYSENFGFAVVEAMACGLAVVITNRVGVHEEIARAKAGRVIDPDCLQLAEQLEQLLNDPLIGKALGEQAKALAQEKFDIDKVAEKLTAAYKSLL